MRLNSRPSSSHWEAVRCVSPAGKAEPGRFYGSSNCEELAEQRIPGPSRVRGLCCCVLSLTLQVLVEVGGNVLLDKGAVPVPLWKLIIICAKHTPWFHIRKQQHEPSLSHRPRKKPRQADCVNGYTPPSSPSPPPHFLANCCAICFQYFPVFSGLFGPKENCYLISFSSQITWEKPKADTRTANRIPGYPGSPLIRGVVEICGGSPVIRE